jgi:hypothetical protein
MKKWSYQPWEWVSGLAFVLCVYVGTVLLRWTLICLCISSQCILKRLVPSSLIMGTPEIILQNLVIKYFGRLKLSIQYYD